MNKYKYGLPGRQRGMTFLGWASLLFGVGFLVFLGLRIIPVYMNEYKVTTAFKEIKKDPTRHSTTPHALEDLLQRHFDIDEVRYVKAKQARFKEVGSGQVQMSLDYEVRKPLFANIDLVFTFKPKIRMESH